MNRPGAWKKVLVFGLYGPAGCLVGSLVGEVYLAVARALADPQSPRAATLITRPTDPPVSAPPPPREFQERLERAGAKTGEVQMSLIWFNKNDLDLHCVDPNGFEIFFGRPRSPSGGELDVDANGPDERRLTSEPVENIYWAKAPPGKYRVFINYFKHRPWVGAPNETQYKVNILYAGKREEFAGTITNNGTPVNPRLIFEFQLYPRIEVFAPGRLELPLTATVSVPVLLRRSYYEGEVRLTAENLPDGVSAEPVLIPEGKTEGEIVLKAASSARKTTRTIKLVGSGGGLTGSTDLELIILAPSVGFSSIAIILIGTWTALLAVGLVWALLAGQNRYLGRPLLAGGRVSLPVLLAGAALAGFLSGSVGQTLFAVLLEVGAGSVGFVTGWVLLGGLLGGGVSYFVANLDRKKATLAGLAGGLLGAVVYLTGSVVAESAGRLAGAAVLGLCIGLMVAVVEAAFRRAWLEVRYGARETITVNLGPEPVKVGGDARACTVWARGAAGVALRYFVRGGRVVCEDVVGGRAEEVGEGDSRVVGGVTVTVRLGSKGAGTPLESLVGGRGLESIPPNRVVAAKSGSQTRPEPKPAVGSPAGSAPVSSDSAAVVSPPLRVAGKSEPVVSPAAGSSARPPLSAPAVVPPATPATAKPANPDGCPGCGRKAPGRPGSRYCVVCDRTF